jgi:hypothetical protein
LNTTSLFTDLTFDDDERRDEAMKSTEDEIVNRLDYNGFHLPSKDTVESVMPRLAAALGPAEAPAVTAGLGRAPSVGRLSVPQAWTVAAPEIRLAAMTLPATSLGAAPEVFAGSPGSLFSQMALASMAGRAIVGLLARATGSESARLLVYARRRRPRRRPPLRESPRCAKSLKSYPNSANSAIPGF